MCQVNDDLILILSPVINKFGHVKRLSAGWHANHQSYARGDTAVRSPQSEGVIHFLRRLSADIIIIIIPIRNVYTIIVSVVVFNIIIITILLL